MKLIILLILSCCAACDRVAPCDPGQTYAHGVCYAAPDAGAPPSDAAANAAADAPHD